MVNVKKVAIFVGGMLFGSAGFKILASKDAKKVYTQTTAAVLRMKDCTMETFWQMQRPSTKPAQPQLNRKLSLMTLLKAPQNNCFFWAACRRPFLCGGAQRLNG